MFTHSLRRFVPPIALFIACTFSNSAFARSHLELVRWNVELTCLPHPDRIAISAAQGSYSYPCAMGEGLF
jgi:hypothetical protein